MTGLVSLLVEGVRWRVVAEARHLFADGAGLRRSESVAVKHGPHRTVCRFVRPGWDVFWKQCRLANLRAWLRDLFRGPKARLEFEKARALTARDVPTVEPLAWGRRGRFWPSESFLVTRALDAVPFAQTVEEKRMTVPTVRQRLAVELGQFIARLHEAGVLHPDPHPGNLLVRWVAGRPTFHLIDVHAVRLGPPLAWPASRDNLVLFNRWFVLRASRSDRLRFWKSYVASRSWRAGGVSPLSVRSLEDSGGLRPPLAKSARELEARTWGSNRRFWLGRDRRRRRGHKLRQLHAGFAVPDLDPDWIHELLRDPDAPFRRPGVRLLKDSRSSTVAELSAPVGGQPRPAIWKRFRVTAWHDPLTALVRDTAAIRSWRFGHGLLERWLPTARPLLVFHRRRFGLVREGYLLTEKLPDAVDLHRWLLGHPAAASRRDLIDRLGRLVRDLHQRGLSHRDLKAANVLVGTHHPFPIWLIDLVGVTAPGRLTLRRRGQNLARLNASFLQSPDVSRTDRLRFLRSYLTWNLHGRGGWKAWWRQVQQATAAKAARNVRRGRPLA